MGAIYQTAVPGTTITASWGNNARDGLVTNFATAAARASAIASPPDGMLTMLQDLPRRFEFWDNTGGLWRPTGAIIECTSSTRPTGRAGMRIYETDTGFTLRYNGTLSKWMRDRYAIMVTASESWTSNTTYSAVTPGKTTPNGGLQFTVEANSRYEWELDLHTQAASGPGVAIQMNYPAGASADSALLGVNNTGAFTSLGIQGYVSGAQMAVVGGTGGTSTSRLRGQIVTAGTPGTVQFGFTQGTSNATTSFLLPASTLKHWQVG